MNDIAFGFPFRSSQKCQLALQIIDEHFGDITRDVAAVVLNSEFPSLAHIVRTVGGLPADKKLNSTQVRSALLVLLQHNCLHVELPPQVDVEGDAPAIAADRLKQKGLVYDLDVDMVINRIRFPKLLKLCQALFGEVGVLIMEELIDGGRLSPTLIRNRTAERLALIKAQELESSGDVAAEIPSPSHYEAMVQNVLEQMIKRRLIISLAPTDFKKKLEERKARAARLLATVSTPPVSVKDAKYPGASTSAPSNGNNSTATNGGNSKQSGSGSSSSNVLTLKRKRATIIDDAEDSFALPLELRMNMGKGTSDVSAANSVAEATTSRGTAATAGSGGGNIRGGRGGRGRGRGRFIAMAAATTTTELDRNDGTNGAGSSSSSSSSSLSFESNSSFYDGPREDSLWVVGWDQYIREKRHAACVQFVTERSEGLAGKVIQLMLDYSLSSELHPTEMNSKNISLNQIHALLQLAGTNSLGGNVAVNLSLIDIGTLQKLLELLRTDTIEVISKVHRSEMEPGGPLYHVNIGTIISALQMKLVHSIAVERYGVASGRIIQILLQKRNLEQQTISDMIIIPAKETRERLYRLYKDQWIMCNEFSKRPDFNPAASSYLWKIDKDKLPQTLLNHLFIALHNIRARRQAQYNEDKHLLTITSMNNQENELYDQLSRSLDRLDNAVILVDQTLMTLQNFSPRSPWN